LHIAREADLDLVEVAPMASPPVCRIMDYSRFKYENEQRAKESRRKTTNVGIKEMKYRPKIGVGDFHTKTRQVSRFLGEGHKVKVTIMFRGREMSHPELGKKILDRVAEEVAHLAKVEAAPKLDGRNMIMVLAPDKRAQQEAAKAAAEADNPTAPELDAEVVLEAEVEAAEVEVPAATAPAEAPAPEPEPESEPEPEAPSEVPNGDSPAAAALAPEPQPQES
jgi:translation initiation factor IF-3